MVQKVYIPIFLFTGGCVSYKLISKEITGVYAYTHMHSKEEEKLKEITLVIYSLSQSKHYYLKL